MNNSVFNSTPLNFLYFFASRTIKATQQIIDERLEHVQIYYYAYFCRTTKRLSTIFGTVIMRSLYEGVNTESFLSPQRSSF